MRLLAARRCPRCGADSEVYDSREDESWVIVRRRRCLSCGMRYKTMELFVGVVADGRKRDGQR